jgi:hypothetical protein
MAAVAPAPPAAIAANPGEIVSPRIARKLRVGVFADRPEQPRWLFEALAQVAAGDFAELSVVFIADKPPAPRTIPALWRAYSAMDRALFARSGDVCAPRDICDLVPASRRRTFDNASALPNLAVRASDFDVAVALGDVDAAALIPYGRFGVWRYCFGEAHATAEPLAGVREVMAGAPVTGVGLRIRRAGGDRVACQSWSRTLDISVAQNRTNLFAKAAGFLARALRGLRERGPRWLEEETAAVGATDDTPEGHAAFADYARLGARIAQRAVERAFTVGQWSLAWRFAPRETWNASLDGFHRLMPPKDRFWADPFPLQKDGRSFIFFEELPFAAGKAHISVVEVDRAGRASTPKKVLERDYHLSYPFLVEEGGELFMIPETAGNRTVEIYRCVDFPAKWRREKVLLEGLWCADATLHRDGERWWMFVNTGDERAEIHDELHLFSAPRLTAEWKPHPRNPVKSDTRSARPAGNLYREGGALYRPAQICAPIYGAGVALQRVTRLTPHEYAEAEGRRIAPAPGAPFLGIHTLNRAGDLSVADFFARRARF